MNFNRSITPDPQKRARISRLSFHRASGHLDPREPGYYLILLRTELRHRSLRRKTPPE